MVFGPFSKQEHVQITTLGLEFAVAEILGVWAGFWLDSKLGTRPWLLVTGAAAGFALGLYLVLKEARALQQKQEKQEK